MTTLLALAAVSLQGGPPPFDPPSLTPPCLRAEPRFAPFALPDDARIVAVSEPMVELARAFAEDFREATGRDLPVAEGMAGRGDIIFSIGGTVVSTLGTDEASAFEVYGDHVAIMGASPRGVARAAARALQLVEVRPDGGIAFPPLLVVDAPQRAWRALGVEIADDVDQGAAERATQQAIGDAIAAAHRYGWNRVVLRGPWTDDGEGAALPMASAWLRSSGAASGARGRGVGVALAMSAAGDPPPVPGEGDPAADLGPVTEVLLDARGAPADRTRAWIEAVDERGLAIAVVLDGTSSAAADALPASAVVLVGAAGGLSPARAAALDRPVVNAGALMFSRPGAKSPSVEGWRTGALGGAGITAGEASDAGLAVVGSLVPYPAAYDAAVRERLLRELAAPAWTGGPWSMATSAEEPGGDGASDAGAGGGR